MPATDTNHPDRRSTPRAGAESGAPDPRSESLLPAGDDDSDGRFAVAEEVNLDQQSDQARRIGRLPPDPAPRADLSEALARALAGANPGQDAHTAPPPGQDTQAAAPVPDGTAGQRS